MPQKLMTRIKTRICKGQLITGLVVALGLIVIWPGPAHAMHIAEGILPAKWAAVWYVIALIFLASGIRSIRKRSKELKGLMPLLGLAGAAVFLISVLPIPVPIAGTCSHPCGTPLAAILVGPLAGSVLGAVALLIQALFLAHGGLSTWGANIVSMAVVGSFAGFGTFVLLRRFNVPIFIAAFGAGILGDWATYATTSLELTTALYDIGSFWKMLGVIALAFAPTQLPLGILEGIFTGGVVTFVFQRRPELLSHLLPYAFRAVPDKAEGGTR